MNSEEQYTLEQPLYAEVRHFHSETNPRDCQSSHTGHIHSTTARETARDKHRHVHGAGPYRPGLGCGILELSNPSHTLHAIMGKTLDNALITLRFSRRFGLTHSGTPKYDGSCLIG
jgi:hypothetical protein